MSNSDKFDLAESCDVAVIGMSGRFPGASDIAAFWRNLSDGVETVSFFSDEELEDDPLALSERDNPAYIKAKGILDDIELFDAAFFNIPAREAVWTDPQQRLFLECALAALEDAGYGPQSYKGSIAVYAGVSTNTYILPRLGQLIEAGIAVDPFQMSLVNEKDYLATRVSYKLNLRGESITVQTACSTSLVAIHLACQSLLSGQCDMALAGGSSIRLPQKTGYLYHEGLIMSPDGHCRAFDHRAQGTVTGNGVGAVVLKLLSRALEDGDPIYAVVKGSAINNDGHLKMGYTAPSIEGQVDVISKALAIAGVDAGTIGYVEAHGTGTPVGDPIEVEALTRAFRRYTDRKGFCALGSIKTNIGHLDVAAGIAGFIKTALALKHRMIPPIVNFERPNPRIDLESSPFFINTTAMEWESGSARRRAGVSSFGVGGTNVHIIMEEPPARPASTASRSCQLLTLSAKTPAALQSMSLSLSDYLAQNPDACLADVAFTQNVGRDTHQFKKFVVAASSEELASSLRTPSPAASKAPGQSSGASAVAFLYPGQGTQTLNAARGLYEHESVLRQHVDVCAQILKEKFGLDLKRVLYPAEGQEAEAARQLSHPQITLPLLLTIEYSLTRLWMSWGIHPKALIGHSFGEYAAACVAGVFSLEEALALAVARGRLFERLPAGVMIGVGLSEAELQAYLTEDVSIASVNGERNCVASGPTASVEELERRLSEKRIGHRRLDVPYAYHSKLIDPILADFRDIIARLSCRPPSIPYVSSLTGNWIKDEEATSPDYWAAQMRGCVRFSDGLNLLRQGHQVFLEIGPDQTLSAIAKQCFGRKSDVTITSSLQSSKGWRSDQFVMLNSLGSIWQAGTAPDWAGFYSQERRYRSHLPTYGFERKRYWLEAPAPSASRREATESRAPRPAQTVASVTVTDSAYSAERPESSVPYVAPRNHFEETLAEIWGEVLGVRGVGIHDNFYGLGGDSLLATQIFMRMKQSFNSAVSINQVLTHQTIAELSDALGGSTSDQAAAVDSQLGPIEPLPREGHLPMSFSQQRLWFTQQSAPQSSVYNLGSAINIKGPLDIRALDRSLNEIIRRHEALRTSFDAVEGNLVQVIAPRMNLPLAIADLSELTEQERGRGINILADENASRPFDLTRLPLLRIVLLKLGRDEHVILFCIHHIVCDGWSFTVFVKELALLYEAFASGQPPALPDLPIQYSDFSRWQARLLNEGMLDAQLSYWRRKLGGGATPLNLPTDRPRPEEPTFKGATYSFISSAGLSRDLKSFSRQNGVTTFVVLLAALKTLLYRYTGQEDVTVGSPIAGRRQIELEGLIGLFINTLALRSDMSGNPTFSELLNRVRQTTLEALENQDLPFEKLVDVLQPDRRLSRAPLFQVFFNFENIPAARLEASDLVLSLVGFDNHATGFDLIWNLTESDDSLIGAVQYSTDLFDEATIARMAGHFQSLLEDVVRRPDARLGDLKFLTEEEEKQRIAEDEAREEFNRMSLSRVRRKPLSIPEEPQLERV